MNPEPAGMGFNYFNLLGGAKRAGALYAHAPPSLTRLLEPRTEPLSLRFSRFQESGGLECGA